MADAVPNEDTYNNNGYKNKDGNNSCNEEQYTHQINVLRERALGLVHSITTVLDSPLGEVTKGWGGF